LWHYFGDLLFTLKRVGGLDSNDFVRIRIMTRFSAVFLLG
jgi:hypothetical protein